MNKHERRNKTKQKYLGNKNYKTDTHLYILMLIQLMNKKIY